MGKKTIDWTGEVVAYAAAIVKNPNMSARGFYRSRGLNVVVADRKIGRRLVALRLTIQDRAVAKAVNQAGLDFAKEMLGAYQANKAMFARGVNAVMPKEEGDEPQFPIKDFDQAMRLLVSGNIGMNQAVKLITGGEPLIEPKPKTYRIEWFDLNAAKDKNKQTRRKSKPRTKKKPK